ncbi:TetR/AcrR family transcriptional regulator [Pseudomonas sp. DWP1b1]|uniref:TetR/AcrR family transcriptional regulator n=1 Tax=unclassified Pseudomonas TaxID=196821 RepID=UPI003CE91B8D
MGRIKLFTREDVLEKAIPVFWRRGFSDTGVADLEKATGVNKSGLYGEFKSKDALFVACLEHYFECREWRALLSAEPLGWSNIEQFLRSAFATPEGQSGCFAINSLRDLSLLPTEATVVFAKNSVILKKLIGNNITGENTVLAPEAITDLILTFFYGLGIEQNIKNPRRAFDHKVSDFLALLVPAK